MIVKFNCKLNTCFAEPIQSYACNVIVNPYMCFASPCTVISPYREEFNLLFTPLTGNKLTVDITIEDDQLVEDNDVLSVFLSTDDPSVDVPNPLAQITLIDDDCKLY